MIPGAHQHGPDPSRQWPVRFSGRLVIGDLLEVLSGDPPAWNKGHRIALIEGDTVRVVNTSKKRDWRLV